MAEKREGPLVTAKQRHWLSDALMANPILVQAIGLAPVVAVATSLRTALVISAAAGAHLVVCEILTSVLLRKLPSWLRVACYFVLGLALIVPLQYLMRRMEDPIVAAMDIFLPLMAINSLAAIRCERFAVLHAVPACLRDAGANALGYGAVAALVGVIREVFGNSSFWGRPFESTALQVRGLWMPFGGFLIIGMLAAGLKLLLRTLSEHGIVVGAHKAMELEPEDREVRREKTRKLFEDAETRRRVLRAAGVLPEEEETTPAAESEPVKESHPKPIPTEAVAQAQGKRTPRPLPPSLRKLEASEFGKSILPGQKGDTSEAELDAALAVLDELKELEELELRNQQGKGESE